VPVLAIGGITVERARGVRAAGGYGVAVIRGIWEADDAPRALRAYLEVLAS
jgi:thiamine monophosphate synthase